MLMILRSRLKREIFLVHMLRGRYGTGLERVSISAALLVKHIIIGNSFTSIGLAIFFNIFKTMFNILSKHLQRL